MIQRRDGNYRKSSKSTSKSQSAMEYLMTYGWAILIIAIVLVAFFSLNLFNPYTFAPKASPGSCQILRPNGPGSNLFVSAVGPTCTTNEIPQYVASFNGQNAYIDLGNSTILSPEAGPNGAMSLCAWYLSLSTNYNGILFKGETQPSGGSTWEYAFGPSGGESGFTIWIPNGGSNIAYSNLPYTLVQNRWYFDCFTYSYSVGNAYYYSYGGQYTAAFSNTVGPAGVGTGKLVVGVGEHGYSNIYLSNIQIYNSSLSPNSVNTLYAEGIGGAPVNIQNLVGWWPLNGNSNDYSGNGNNGVPTGVTFTSNWESGYTAP